MVVFDRTIDLKICIVVVWSVLQVAAKCVSNQWLGAYYKLRVSSVSHGTRVDYVVKVAKWSILDDNEILIDTRVVEVDSE